MHEVKPGITLDIDSDRIRTVLREAYASLEDMLSPGFDITADEFVARVDPYLACNRVSIPVTVRLPCRKYPELQIIVDIRRRGILAKFRNPKIQADVNRYLKTL